MTATRESLSWLAHLDGRCPRCFLHVSQGHRGTLDDLTTVTGCTPSGPVGLAMGRHLAAVGMARTVEAHPDDAALVDAAIRDAIRVGKPFSANALRHLTAQVSEPNVIGAQMRSWISSKRLKRVGDEPSDSPGTHAHRIGLYVERTAA